MACRPLSDDYGVVLESLGVRQATVDILTQELLWDTGRVVAAVDLLRADGFLIGADHMELSGSGRFHVPSEQDRPIDPS